MGWGSRASGGRHGVVRFGASGKALGLFGVQASGLGIAAYRCGQKVESWGAQDLLCQDLASRFCLYFSRSLGQSGRGEEAPKAKTRPEANDR